MRRRKLLWLLATALGVFLVGVRVLWPRPDRATIENYERLRVGMTRAEVEGIVGPPGDYATGPVAVGYDNFGPKYDVWVTDTWVIYIHYDGSIAATIECTPALAYGQSRLDKLLWPLKRPFRKWLPDDRVRE